MQKRLPEYDGHYPWWGWHQPKPNPSRTFWKACIQLERLVRIELAIPTERVLLSHYPAWEMVLNKGLVCATPQGYRDWEAELSNNGVDDRVERMPALWQSRVEASLEMIFDLPALDAGEEWSAGWVQATFERLDIAAVVTVSEFCIIPSLQQADG